jgi:hypothetical protein
MLHEADLEDAVAGGIITTEQAAALRALAEVRTRDRPAALGHEERFQFMRSFNDFFFAIGVALLGGGLIFFTFMIPLHSLFAGVAIWALAELLVGRMRLVLPGILLVCLFVVFVVLASPIDFLFAASAGRPSDFDALMQWFVTPRHQGPFAGGSALVRELLPFLALSYIGAAGVGALLFYLRFRLPFALLLVAAAVVAATLTPVVLHWPNSPAIQSSVLLACGVAVFLAAMMFDASDRERLTRRADCAFWLHLLAAPLIVHSLIELVWLRSGGIRSAATLTAETAVAVAAIIAVLAIVAVITDRRALLVSALTYLGIVIGYAITNTIGQQGADKSVVFFATLLVLGLLVVTLGVGWQPLRRMFMAMLPQALTGRLPPAVAKA